MTDQEKPQVTAGMRGASWDARLMTRPYQMVPYALTTQDGQRTLGFLFTTSGKEKTVVSLMHPREMAITHYLVPSVLDAGCACWVQGPRSIGNDLRLEHEIALLDVAAGMTHLRDLGYQRIVLLGNSGGAGLYAFYNQQSHASPEQRIARTPGGRPTNLAEAQMPTVDGMIFVSPHPGQGKLLMSGIDPSVVDENDPMQIDASLDPFSTANGFDVTTGRGHYEPGFVERYRMAQEVRVARIDERARALLKAKQEAKQRIKAGSGTEVDRRVAAHAPIFQVWRTDADLRSWDISLDPSDRKTGSLWGKDPFVSNWGSVGFGRVVTPESWLSTWSGLSSNAALEKTLDALHQPTLLLEYTGDQCTFPTDIQAIYQQIPSACKQHLRVRGNHHGMALSRDEEPGQRVAGRHIADWLRNHMV
ncbi:MAG: alpha/beta hydrolase [Comamonas sp.]|jgi:pimeloyl-ACP methyl ester carboxylesterase|uniref:alpha/beta hydrolase n=1 Tax=Comamonas sp. TaxID=34028 RepID=UPI00282EC7A0|nr:alpha/beta hydrolase [Comamonas sp.]MDR0216013.1 alpha/beta hydrolase [Comamonas sp.]